MTQRPDRCPCCDGEGIAIVPLFLWALALLIVLGSVRVFSQVAPPGLAMTRGPLIGVKADGATATIRVPRQYGSIPLPDHAKVTLRLAVCPGARPAKIRNLARPGFPPEFRVEQAPAVLAIPRPPDACGLRMDAQAVAPLWRVPWVSWGPMGDRLEWKIPYPADLKGTGLGVQVLVEWGGGLGLYSDVVGVVL